MHYMQQTGCRLNTKLKTTNYSPLQGLGVGIGTNSPKGRVKLLPIYKQPLKYRYSILQTLFVTELETLCYGVRNT
jgi:hypothetical protein